MEMKRLVFSLFASIAAGACTSAVTPLEPSQTANQTEISQTEPSQTEPSEAEPKRDVAAYAKSMAGISILDVDRFEHTADLKGCPSADLPREIPPADSALAKAIDAAKAYSDEAQGTSLIVLVDGKIVHESYDRGLSADGLTASYSMKKSLLALVFAAALDDGIITSLDEEIGLHIPSWRDDPRGKITVRQLLHMASGQKPAPFSSEASVALLWSDDINSVALSGPSQGPAGEQFWYKNANSQIAGIALDNALKKAGHSGYVDYVNERIWCTLGNSSAKIWLDRPGGSPHYFAGMFAKGRDWARVGELIRKNGVAGGRQVISRASLSEILAPSPTNPNYAAHIWLGKEWNAQRQYGPSPSPAVLHSEPYLADDVIFFDGFGGQRVYIVPSAKLTIVRTGLIDFAYDDAVIVNALLAADLPS
jgi:CubicO group peptidase (beta-lactamase class C family)